MPIKLNAASGGSVSFDVPSNTSSTYTLTAPARTGTIITSADSNTVTGSIIAYATVAPVNLSQPLTVLPAVSTSTGATSYTLASGLPSWIKRVTVTFTALTCSASTNPMVQLVTGGGTVTSGYTYNANYLYSGAGITNFTNGFGLRAGSPGSGDVQTGSLVLYNVTGNTWQASLTGYLYSAGNYTSVGGGWITLSAPLTGLLLTSSGGATTYSAGNVAVFYE